MKTKVNISNLNITVDINPMEFATELLAQHESTEEHIEFVNRFSSTYGPDYLLVLGLLSKCYKELSENMIGYTNSGMHLSHPFFEIFEQTVEQFDTIIENLCDSIKEKSEKVFLDSVKKNSKTWNSPT